MKTQVSNENLKDPLWETQPGMILRGTDSKIVDWIKVAQDSPGVGLICEFLKAR